MHKIILIIIAMVVNQAAANLDPSKQGVKVGHGWGENSNKQILKSDLECHGPYNRECAILEPTAFTLSLELFTNFKPK